MVNILGIETSCDETGVAVVHGGNFQFPVYPSRDRTAAGNFQKNNVGAGFKPARTRCGDFRILAEGLASSVDLQKEYGGVVPELASRVHVEKINLLLAKCLKQAKLDWSDIDAIAVANGPGLVGSLLVGTMVAKTLGMVLGKPLISVNHLEGHICSAFLAENTGIFNFQFFPRGTELLLAIFNKFSISNFQKNNVGAGFKPAQIGENNKNQENTFPMLVLIVSGGHTELLIMKDFGEYEMLGSTVDDAAGEAFDKAAKILGLDYPGGPSISRRAAECNFQFPISSFQTNNVGAGFPRPSTEFSGSEFSCSNVNIAKGGGTPPVQTGENFDFVLPRPMIETDDFNFSFSGLKTALLYKWKEISNFSPHGDQLVPKFPISKKFPMTNFQIEKGKNISRGGVTPPLRDELVNRMAYEFQEAVVDVLVTKTVKAAEKFKINKVAIVGGVAANGRFREEMKIRLDKIGRQLIVPPIKYCTDNGAKIAVAGFFKYLKKDFTDWKKLEVNSNWEL
ncbi:MAG: tRNA (adenosine(37)-N6)-threonylcarbamoyltransferase complex transferase subunit TsaD [Patescibacteria group bacterium]